MRLINKQSPPLSLIIESMFESSLPVLRACAAGEGGDPLHRGVGRPIHTPTPGGGDRHTFIPFTSLLLYTPPVILAIAFYSN